MGDPRPDSLWPAPPRYLLPQPGPTVTPETQGVSCVTLALHCKLEILECFFQVEAWLHIPSRDPDFEKRAPFSLRSLLHLYLANTHT